MQGSSAQLESPPLDSSLYPATVVMETLSPTHSDPLHSGFVPDVSIFMPQSCFSEARKMLHHKLLEHMQNHKLKIASS